MASVMRVVAIVTELPELLFAGRIIVSVMASVNYESLILYLQVNFIFMFLKISKCQCTNQTEKKRVTADVNATIKLF